MLRMMIRHQPKWHSDHPVMVVVLDIDEMKFGTAWAPLCWEVTPFDFSPPGLLVGLSDDYWDWLPER